MAFLNFVMALSPIIVVLVGILGFHQSAKRVAPVALVWTLILAFTYFNVTGATFKENVAVYDALIWKGIKEGLKIVLMVFGAFVILNLLRDTGGIPLSLRPGGAEVRRVPRTVPLHLYAGAAARRAVWLPGAGEERLRRHVYLRLHRVGGRGDPDLRLPGRDDPEDRAEAVRADLLQDGGPRAAGAGDHGQLLVVSYIMQSANTGMMNLLASDIASVVGRFYPAAAVLIGASGSFITGTGLGSNIMFADMHIQAAEALGMNPITVFAGQNAGASLGNLICPNNTVAACATVDQIGNENQVMKRTLPAFAVILVIYMVLTMLYTCVLFPTFGM